MSEGYCHSKEFGLGEGLQAQWTGPSSPHSVDIGLNVFTAGQVSTGDFTGWPCIVAMIDTCVGSSSLNWADGCRGKPTTGCGAASVPGLY